MSVTVKEYRLVAVNGVLVSLVPGARYSVVKVCDTKALVHICDSLYTWVLIKHLAK